MSNKDLLNWSADLRRISIWLQTGNTPLASKFIQRGRLAYASGHSFAGHSWQWWLDQLSLPNTQHAAERALTWSLLLTHHVKASSN